jgi:hypothetical protein
MRGFPPIQLFLLCLAFIVLAVPLSHLTGNTSNAKVIKVAAKEAKSVKALLRLRFAHKPATLSLKLADKELITCRCLTARTRCQCCLPPKRAWMSS